MHEVVELERALLTTAVRGSTERLDALLDPEFREIGASGRLWTRPEMVAALLAERGGTTTAAEQFEVVGLTPDLVLLHYISDPNGRAARRTSLWRRTDGRWRLLHHQGTPTEPR